MPGNRLSLPLLPGVRSRIDKVCLSVQMAEIMRSFESFHSERHRPTGERGTHTDTIGYGHLLTDEEHSSGIIVIDGLSVDVNDGISRRHALALFRHDVSRHKERFVPRYVPPKTQVSQAEFDGLMSFVFNTGGAGWVANGPLYGFVRAGQWGDASDYVRTHATTSGGNRLRGLVARRAFEADIIRDGKTHGGYQVDGRKTNMSSLAYDEARNRVDRNMLAEEASGGGTAVPAPTESPAVAPTPVAPNQSTTYRVRPGDSLSQIAREHGATLARLLILNPQIEDPDRIFSGDLINIGAISSRPAATGSAAGLPTAPDRLTTYRVRSGDTMSRIAVFHGVSLEELKRLNPQIEDFDLIFPGALVNVPVTLEEGPSIHLEAVGDSNEPWFDIALREMATGVDEMRGAADNPRIVEYHQTTTLKATDDETPWCSSFVNWCMIKSGNRGTNSAAARSWLKWGKELSEPRRGCVVVFSRPPSPTSGHVAFFDHVAGGRIFVLGGNQGNAVNITSYPYERLLGYRWPA